LANDRQKIAAFIGRSSKRVGFRESELDDFDNSAHAVPLINCKLLTNQLHVLQTPAAKIAS